MPPEISNHEAIQMMARCREEILNLRVVIDRLQPKADAYDTLAAVVEHMVPQKGRTSTSDLVWTLEQRIRELQPKPGAASPAQ